MAAHTLADLRRQQPASSGSYCTGETPVAPARCAPYVRWP